MSAETAPETVPVPFAAALEDFADRTALITAEGALSYRDLARRADLIGERLGSARAVRAARDEGADGSGRRDSVRRLVVVAAGNDVDTIAGYLAALRHGHPVLLVPRDPDTIEAVARVYGPDVVLNGPEIDERHPASAHTLHPDLALLLSTSGSTGSPKLVRLSRDSIQSNAEAIATYLEVRPDDRAVATLPLHYCYGLSILHSHLSRGAAVILTDLSVADRGFWDLFRRERGTTFAGVPYTFDLLDRVGFAELELPDLRYVTQAGGRLDPVTVRRYASLGRRRGWDLFVMYGQTEATARMAYLPPDLAETAPDAVGIPIPGGSFRITADDELVYCGPNVMLGYAEHPADLGLGRVVHELYTGDLARRGDDGLYRIIGRRNRFLKVFGLRLELNQVESRLAGHGVAAFCAGDDQSLVVAVEEAAVPAAVAPVRRRVAEVTGLPPSAISVQLCTRIPRLASGKPDYPAIASLSRRPGPDARSGGADDPVVELVRLYATILDREDVTPGHSFVDLGGDSLSYVETSVRLEQLLGTLPPNWHATSIADLAITRAGRAPDGRGPERRGAEPRRRRVRRVETSVLLRAVAIVLVVGTHVQLFGLPGGAHMLLGVAGFNFARFQLTGAGRGGRLRGIARSVGRVAVATVSWVALVLLVTDQYTLANVFLVNRVVGTDELHNTWHLWFIEDLIYLIVAASALLSIGAVDRWERRWPFALPVALTVIGLVARYQLVPGVELPRTMANAWLFTIGWAAARATSPGHLHLSFRRRTSALCHGCSRLRGSFLAPHARDCPARPAAMRLAPATLLTAAAMATVPGFFGDPGRELVVIVGLLLLIWVPSVPASGTVVVVAGALASASLYIYLVHWQVYPHLWQTSPLLALVASLAAGLLYAALFGQVLRRAHRLTGRVATLLRAGWNNGPRVSQRGN